MSFSTLQTISAQTLVIGTGISGLFTALKLAQAGISVLLVTKTALAETNSRYAQGGIAAFLPQNTQDSLELHVQDTLSAGAGLCDEAAVRSILAEGHLAVADLLSMGVAFDLDSTENIALTREAAHSVSRILHARGDATGAAMEEALLKAIEQSLLIQTLSYFQIQELLTKESTVYGALAVNIVTGEGIKILADAIVLATGGIGQLYEETTNPSIATGDGLALAYRAGAALSDLEFVQFHPTAFYAKADFKTPSNPIKTGAQFLISEALRGEGGILRNHLGEAFSLQYHPLADLAPRDIVTRAIFDQLQRYHLDCVYLDMTHLDKALLLKRFPSIIKLCNTFGINLLTDWIPVTPAAHYSMGGISVNPWGKTTINKLYAVGEVARTGLHGANRLASNSLLECVVLARRVAEQISEQNQSVSLKKVPQISSLVSQASILKEPTLDYEGVLNKLKALMSNQVGIVRTQAGLIQALAWLTQTETTLKPQLKAASINNPALVEAFNQIVAAKLITQAALKREKSVGAHFIEEMAPTHRESKDEERFLASC